MAKMAEDENERQPLLDSGNNNTGSQIRSNLPPYSGDTEGATIGVFPIGPDELPPASSNANGVPMITCRVCQAMIDISEKRDQHVVKCNQCYEATPIKHPPPGKKYVRCPCHCLLICKVSSQRIACPRPNCKRIINLAPSPVTPPMPSMPGMDQINCAHCNNAFLFNTLHNTLARCPHCRKVSSVGQHFAQGRAILYAAVAVVFLVVGLGVTIGTYSMAVGSGGGIYVLYIGAFLLALIAFARSIYFCRMKVSHAIIP